LWYEGRHRAVQLCVGFLRGLIEALGQQEEIYPLSERHKVVGVESWLMG
jgi:hypothetical protein